MASTMMSAGARRVPWHLWAVGVLGILWNAVGCYDYTMTAMQGEAYLRSMNMSDAMIAYMNAMPAWTTAVWAIGVWGGMVGSVLILVRSKWAYPVFVASLAAFVLSRVYMYLMSDGAAAMPDMSWIMDLVILAICLFLVWYARMMTKRGVLR